MAALMPGRRAVLLGAAAFVAAPALRLRAGSAPALGAILEASGLGAVTGCALVDVASGALVEAHRADAGLPPGSVAKVVTTLWGLAELGADYRFRTGIRAVGGVDAGVVRGDLVLAGGGDPLLDTDALGDLAAALRMRGVRGVRGRIVVAGGALPAVAELDPGQPAEASYNPTLSGTMLNFNRVNLAWKPGGSGPELAFAATGARFNVGADGFAAELAAGGLARHRIEAGREVWTLPRASLPGRGEVWLPVRDPAAYAGAVFARLLRDAGITVDGGGIAVAAEPAGGLLAVREGEPLAAMLRDMLRYSTNLTAEAVGIRASQAAGAAPASVARSAAAMSAWARARFGLAATALVDHSGLGAASRTTAADLAAVLRQGATLGLPELLHERAIRGPDREAVEIGGVRVRAKTGTLDFVSALAGYIEGARRLAFAILVADPGRRAAIRPEERADPPGGEAWLARARAEQQALLRRWASLHA